MPADPFRLLRRGRWSAAVPDPWHRRVAALVRRAGAAPQGRFPLIGYDLRGHGKSPLAQPPYTLDDLVADLEALRAELGIDARISPATRSAA